MKQRSEILAHAETLVSGGVSRRRMDAILRAEHGHSIGKATFTKLYRSRVQQISGQPPTTGFRHPVNRKQSNYNALIAHHFLPDEARVLTRSLKTLRLHEIGIMTRQRERLFNDYQRKAVRNEYTRAEFWSGWREYVLSWYDRTARHWKNEWARWNIKKGHNLSKTKFDFRDLVWAWFGRIKSGIPKGYEYGKRKPKKDFVEKNKLQTARFIHHLRSNIAQTTDPERKAQLQKQIARLQETLK